MLLFEQLELFFTPAPAPGGRDDRLEAVARELLYRVGADALVPIVRVEWNARLQTAAGRADYRRALVSLNPRLHEHGEGEIDRTLRHELAHLVAHLRAGRRCIAPHGAEWRRACADLGIAGEARCHTLPFPARQHARRYLYRCPRCAREFPRARKIRRRLACLACCRQYAQGQFSSEFLLQLATSRRRLP